MDLDPILRCPRCKGPLEHRATDYVCGACRIAYPVLDGIASFIPSDALPVETPAPDAKP